MNKYEAEAVFYKWTAYILGAAYAVTLGLLLFVCASAYGKDKAADSGVIRVQLGVMK